jgi:hypothetical protein
MNRRGKHLPVFLWCYGRFHITLATTTANIGCTYTVVYYHKNDAADEATGDSERRSTGEAGALILLFLYHLFSVFFLCIINTCIATNSLVILFLF